MNSSHSNVAISKRWVCCQLGAREHYAVPRALHDAGRLRELVVDAWVKPGSPWRFVPVESAHRLCERFHPELESARVRHFTLPLIVNEFLWNLRRRRKWELFAERNCWFQRCAATEIGRLDKNRIERTTLFAHSYSALEIFKRAKLLGWTTVLGQIDPGEEHYRIVRRACEEWSEYGPAPKSPPDAYFAAWREECTLADWIIVNSNWSREALVRAGIPSTKIRVIPLAYQPETNMPEFGRKYPPKFSAARPLRVLFVGQATVAKGFPALLEGVGLLGHVAIELRVVGRLGMNLPPRFGKHKTIRWLGHLPRSEVMRHYREADVLIFPSLSDGFGMAQVEAQGWGLPIIASRFCGSVVRDGFNGIILPEVSPEAVAAALGKVAKHPELLVEFARNSKQSDEFGLQRLADNLLRLPM